MNRLIKFSITHPVSIIMYFTLLIIAGIISAVTIPVDFLPNIKDRFLLISTVYEGIPAEEMQQLVTNPVEDSFSSLPGIKNISSITRDNYSFLKIELHYGTNINKALIESRQIIDSITKTLPENCSRPEVEIFQSDRNKLFTISIIPKNKNLSIAKNIVENDIKHIFQTTEGISKVKITGGRNAQIEIKVNDNFTNSKNIPLTMVAESILNTNFDYSAGFIKDSSNDYLVKTTGSYKNYNDILNTSFLKNDTIYKLNDFCTISTQDSEKETFAFYNNNECIQIDLFRQTNYNPLKLAKNISIKLKQFSIDYPNLDFIITFDNTKEIISSIKSIILSIIISFIITYSVIFIFFRNKIISVLLTIPVFICIIFSTLCLKITGRTINLFSLSGISISIGMLVDASIVVIENIISNTTKKTNDGLLINSIIEVKTSTFNSALTTAIVFIPFFLFPGIFGELFSDLSIAVISSILLSSILSITFVPACYKLLFEKNKNSHIKTKRLKLTSKYKKSLEWSLSHKKTIFTIFSLSSFLIIPLFFFIPKELISENKSDTISFTTTFPQNFSVTKIQNNTENKINLILKTFPELNVTATAGIDSKDYNNLSDIFSKTTKVKFTINPNRKINQHKLIDFINANFPDPIFQKENQFIADTIDYKPHYIINESHQDYHLFENDFNAFPNEIKTEYSFTPDQSKLDYYQINKADLSQHLFTVLSGINCGTLKNSDIPLNIILKCKSESALQNMTYPKEGKLIPLSALGSFSISDKNKVLFRYNKKESKLLSAIPDSLKNSEIVSLQKEKTQELITSAVMLITISSLLLYCILGAQFESFSFPLKLLISILPGFTGSLFSLLLSGQTLNVNSFLSLIIISGIAINNSIILFEAIPSSKILSMSDYINLLSDRLRPILITTTTSVLSLIPFIFIPAANSSQNSLAISICGGLTTSLFSSLLVFPLLINKTLKVNK